MARRAVPPQWRSTKGMLGADMIDDPLDRVHLPDRPGRIDPPVVQCGWVSRE